MHAHCSSSSHASSLFGHMLVGSLALLLLISCKQTMQYRVLQSCCHLLVLTSLCSCLCLALVAVLPDRCDKLKHPHTVTLQYYLKDLCSSTSGLTCACPLQRSTRRGGEQSPRNPLWNFHARQVCIGPCMCPGGHSSICTGGSIRCWLPENMTQCRTHDFVPYCYVDAALA